ncbi:MAG: S41 family peptidase [Calditrichia bacterium]
MKKSSKITIITLFALLFFAGTGLVINNFANAQSFSSPTIDLFKKFNRVIELVRFYYVEEVDWKEAFEGAISGMLEKLDPHSVYIPEKELKRSNENFSGKYEGIGIYYDVLDGAVLVVSPIAGSPAEEVGLMAGDKIIEIEGESTIGLSRDDVPAKLKGPKGSKVRVKIVRDGLEEPFEVTITRDVIPINTVTTAFMFDEETAYIFVNRFAETTSLEVEQKLREFEAKGMKRLILDLRGNPGGYLLEAVKLAGKFLPDKKLIVYTKNRGGATGEEYFSDFRREGPYRNIPLIVLVDRGSASASEIVAGAIQDHDRGLVLGTRTFGKGLVQRQFDLNDNSAVRITIAKYYTPSGRCIQRPYKGLNNEKYYLETMTDTSQSSIDSSEVFYTAMKRKVYGGGGIIPDVIIPYKSFSKARKLTQKLSAKRMFFEFASYFSHKKKLNYKSIDQFHKNFDVNPEILHLFENYLQSQEFEYNKEEFDKDKEYLSKMIKAEVARILFGSEAYYEILMRYDNQVIAALSHFSEAKKFAQRYK